MELSLILIGRLLLAAVFVTAGTAKLRDLPGSRRAVAEFGVPRRLATVLGMMLPAAELAVAGSLIADPTAAWGALAALALLLAFAVAIVWNLGRGRAPDCHCFGQLHSSPASWRTVARNLGLAAVAGLVAWELTETALTIAIAGAGVVALLPAVPSAWRRAGTAAARAGASGLADREGLPVGTPAPGFRLPAPQGLSVTLESLRAAGRPVLLLFTDPNCGPCIELAPKVARWQREHSSELTIAVIERLRDGSRLNGHDPHGRRNVLLQRDSEVSDLYLAHGTPTAVLVGRDGAIASAVAAGSEAIETLMARTVPAFGTPGPARRRRSRMPGARPVGGPLARRELLVRAASACAAAGAALAVPGRAVAGEIIVLKCKYVRCGNRCCPKKAVCRTRRGKKVCICPDGRRACGKRCCPPTFVCKRTRRGRRCTCPKGHRVCAGRCVRVRTDPDHCGECRDRCPDATSCVDGECVGGDGTGSGPGGTGACECPRGETCCDGACTDLNTSDAHCGRCHEPCPAGRACCEGRCRDLQSDPRNCGECGKRCRGGKVCANGKCAERCPKGMKNCDGKCVDTQSDVKNCGGCGRDCGSQSGMCWACCGGECIDLYTHGDHCGECFRRTPEGCICFGGRSCGNPHCPDVCESVPIPCD